MLLSSHFQGFCRDLHSECVDSLTLATTPAVWKTVLRTEFVQYRKLDKGNPNPGNIGADFSRLGVVFWDDVKAHDAQNNSRRAHLEKLNDWRNAIAHQDFDPAKLGGTTPLRLMTVRSWRQSAHHLAVSFDAVMLAHITFLTGTPPW
ncbi:MAG: HEPN domain-containing protein [Armatimonadota bacterium]|nr:HEPN domain-containing protein [Armatimonadota bacterium]